MFPRWIPLGLIGLVVLVSAAGPALASEASSDDPEPGAVRLNPKDRLAYVWIPPGRFQMGCVPGDLECQVDESPRHEVVITRGFWMGQTEVTIEAFRKLAKKAKLKIPPKPRATSFGKLSGTKSISSRFDGGPGKKQARPIVNVTWDEAKRFCEYTGGRLPTEAEWEYAARGEKEGQKYPWGDTLTHDDANYGNMSGLDQWRYTAPVASFPPNDYGLHDMIGNAWEWCADWLDGNYYRRSPANDPPGPANGTERAVRGGSWGFHPEWLRTSARVRGKPDGRGDDIGFRCVRDTVP